MFTAFLARNNPVRAINANNGLQKMEQHRSGDFDKKLYLPAAIQALQKSKCTPQQMVRTILALDADSDPQLFRYTSALACNRSSSKWFPFADKAITRSTAFLLFTLFATTHPFNEAFSEVVQKPRGHDWQKNIFANSTGGQLNKLKFMEWLAEMLPDLNPESLYQNLKSYMADFHVSGYSASKPEYYIDLPGCGSKYDLSLPKEGIKYPQLVPVAAELQTDEVVAEQGEMGTQTVLCADAATGVEYVAQRETATQAVPERADVAAGVEVVVADTSMQATLERIDVSIGADVVAQGETATQAAPERKDADTQSSSLEQANTIAQTDGSLTADGNAYVRVHMLVEQQEIASVSHREGAALKAAAAGDGTHSLSRSSSRSTDTPNPTLSRLISNPISIGSDDPERRSPLLETEETPLRSVLARHGVSVGCQSVAQAHQSESPVLPEAGLAKVGVNVVSTAAETEEDEDNYETKSDSVDDWNATDDEFDEIFGDCPTTSSRRALA